MKLPRRRQFLHLVAGATMLPLMPRIARGQAYPSGPIRLAQAQLTSEIAPGGKLRSAAIGVQVVHAIAEPVGKFIAERLGVPYEPVIYPNPPAYARSFGKDEWDIAIGGRVFATADKSELSANVWLIDLIYVAAPGREFADASQADRRGVRVGVVQGSPSDGYLTRTLKSAEIVRVPLGPNTTRDAIEKLRGGDADLFGLDAGLGYEIADGLPGAKVVPGAFNTVPVAVALPKGRSAAAQVKIGELIKEAKQTGVVQKAIERAGLRGLHVAPD
jgi:polar amino acid transport system substrate-binding protein